MSPKILIADGVQTMRGYIRNALEEENFTRIIEADNGEEACSVFEAELPDIVIIDISIPAKSGLECLKEMKKKNPDAKVIICSASGTRELVIHAAKLGASDFILKPLKPQRLILGVNKCLDNL